MARHRFKGRKRWHLRLEKLKPAARIEIEAAAEKNAKEVAALARSWAPVSEDGPNKGALKRSIKAEGLSVGKAIRWRVVAGDEEAFYARWVEFGTAPGVRGQRAGHGGAKQAKSGRKSYRTHPGTKAQPYFFPAYRALRRRIRNRNARALGRAVKKVFK